jgi:hypothetical protein
MVSVGQIGRWLRKGKPLCGHGFRILGYESGASARRFSLLSGFAECDGSADDSALGKLCLNSRLFALLCAELQAKVGLRLPGRARRVA